MFLFWLQQSCCILTCITEPGHCKFSWLPKAFTFHCHLLCKGVSLSSVTFPPRRGDVASQPGKVPQCPQGHSPLLDQHLLREAPQPQTHLCPSSWNCLKAFLKTFLWDTMAMRTAPEEFNAIFSPRSLTSIYKPEQSDFLHSLHCICYLWSLHSPALDPCPSSGFLQQIRVFSCVLKVERGEGWRVFISGCNRSSCRTSAFVSLFWPTHTNI